MYIQFAGCNDAGSDSDCSRHNRPAVIASLNACSGFLKVGFILHLRSDCSMHYGGDVVNNILATDRYFLVTE